ncbi:MAG: FKBP-type peptidyl-prolyl cis-trans isomerase [Muribaculaceae bacterium]|nr:FKBP-type peptidyl-prolyl cis-trans isomerase [Muribaculaceae bacterium]
MKNRARIASVLAGAVLVLSASGQPVGDAQPKAVAADSTSTALAVFIGDVVKEALSSHETLGMNVDRTAFLNALNAYLTGQPVGMNGADARSYLNGQYAKAQTAMPAPLPPADPKQEEAALAAAAARTGVMVFPSGTVLEILTEGTGSKPTEDGIAEMRYVGTLTDGTVFDEVRADEASLDFPVAALLPGMTEALLSGLMKSGGRYVLTIPASAGYGNEGVPGKVPPGATLRFVIDLIDAE